MSAERISVQEAYGKIKDGRALLVCGYEDDAKYQAVRLEMSMPFSGFLKKLPTLPRDQEIIFYCA